MKRFSIIGTLTLLFFACTLPASSEPYAPSCERAIEKVRKARKDMVPYQLTIELARASERLAYADLAVCARGGIFSLGKAVACNEASWKAPLQTKELIVAEDEYLQGRKEFEERFEQARAVCLHEP